MPRPWTMLLLVVLPGLLGAIELKPGQTVHARFGAGTSAWEFSAEISVGETIRFTLEQGNNDLAAMITMPDGRILRFDQFEFGPETLTLTSHTAGSVQLVVAPTRADAATADFSISRPAFTAYTQGDENESDVELLATKAKAGAAEKSAEAVSDLSAAL